MKVPAYNILIKLPASYFSNSQFNACWGKSGTAKCHILVSHNRSKWSDRDFVLSGEVGPFTQQLALRQGEDTGSFSNQHCVVQATVTRSSWDQVTTLNTDREKCGEERRSTHLCILYFHIDILSFDQEIIILYERLSGNILFKYKVRYHEHLLFQMILNCNLTTMNMFNIT